MDELKIAQYLMKWRKAKGIECSFWENERIDIKIRERAIDEEVDQERALQA